VALLHPARPVRHARSREGDPAPLPVAALPAPGAPTPTVGVPLVPRTPSLLSRAVDRVPAGWWRLTALFLAGRYLVLVAAFAVVLLDPEGAASDLAPVRGVGEVSVLLAGRPAGAAVLAGGLAGWALLLLVRAVLLRCGLSRPAGSAALVVAASALTAALNPALAASLVAVGLAVLGALRLLRGAGVR